MSRRSRARSRWRARSPWRCIPCASCRAPIEQGGRQFARLVCEFRLATGIAVHLRPQAGGFCFSCLAALEHRDAMPYVLQPSFLSFLLDPPETRHQTPNIRHLTEKNL